MTGSNSHSGDTYVATDVTGHGLDTISLAWRGDAAHDLVAALGDSFHGEGKARTGPGGAYLETIEPGITVGAYPDHGMAFIEGRLAPILTGESTDRTLYPADILADNQDAIWERAAGFYGLDNGTPDSVGVRRADLSVDVGFSGGCGLGLLDGIASLDPPRYKLTVYRSGSRTETVNLITAKRGVIVMRVYDKGMEQGTGRPGETIRMERPMRFGKAKQMAPEELAGIDLAKAHRGGLAPFAAQAESVEVVSPGAAGATLLDLWRAGKLSRAEARRLAGHVLFAHNSVPLTKTEQRVDQRDRADLRAVGLAVTDWDVMEGKTLALGDVLRSVAEVW